MKEPLESAATCIACVNPQGKKKVPIPTRNGAIVLCSTLRKKLNTPEALRERLAITSEFDERRMREAGKYKALFDMPNAWINAYSVPAQIQAQGAASIAQMMAQGAQNIPSLTNYQRAGFSFTPNRYF